MATQFLFANNAVTTLAVTTTTGATSLTVADGSLFPNPGAGQQFAITLLDAATGVTNEIAYCTGRASNVLTIVRAREGTAAVAWPSGTTVANFITRDTLAQFAQAGTAGDTDYWPGTGTDTITVTPAPAYDAYFTGMTILLGVQNSNTGAATLNVNGLGAKDIRDQNDVALTANMLLAGRIMPLIYDGTRFRLMTTAPVSSFIATLPVAAVLNPSDLVALSQSGAAVQTDLGDLTSLVSVENFADAFFLGMMG